MGEQKSAFWLAILNIISVVFFILLVVMLNGLGMVVSNPILARFILFINENALLLIGSGLLVGIGDICLALFFPLSFAGPLIRAGGNALFTFFILKLFWLIDEMLGISVFEFLRGWAFVLCAGVFILAAVFGYFKLFFGFAGGRR